MTELSPFPPDVAAARDRAAAAYRRLGHAFAAHVVDAATAEDLADALESWADRLEEGELRDRGEERRDREWGGAPASGERMYSFDDRPISGRGAPIGIDLDIVRDGDEVAATFELGPAHEGAPARSHGGIVAAILDDLFGFVLTILETPGFTGTLSIRYEAGTPIGEPLECRVRLDERQGRKLLMSGEITAADDPTAVYARATAVFIAVEFENFHHHGAAAT